MIDNVQYHLHGGGNDGAAARRAGDQQRLVVFHHNRGSHGTEHALAWLNGVGLATNYPIVVGHIVFGREVVHLVVEKKTGALDDNFAAVGQIQGGGIGNRVALGVHNGCVGGFHTFERHWPRAYVLADTRLAGIKICESRLGVSLINQLLDGYRVKVHVAQMFCSICVGSSFGFDDGVYGLCAAIAHGG